MIHYFHVVLSYIFLNFLWKFLIGHFMCWNYAAYFFLKCLRDVSIICLHMLCFILFQKSYLLLVCPVEYIANKTLRSTLRCEEMLCFEKGFISLLEALGFYQSAALFSATAESQSSPKGISVVFPLFYHRAFLVNWTYFFFWLACWTVSVFGASGTYIFNLLIPENN